MPSVAKKRLLRKKFKRHYLCSNQKLASTQTIGSAFLERVRKVQNSIYKTQNTKYKTQNTKLRRVQNSEHDL